MAAPTPVERWWPKLRWLAQVYKIKVIHVPASLWSEVLEDLYSDHDSPAHFMRMYDHGFELRKRRLYLVFEDREHGMRLYNEYTVERALHEMAHIICQPSFCTIDDVGEDWMLMQVERAISRALFLPHDKRSHQAVVNWQEATTSQFYDCLLVDAHDDKGSYWHTKMWHDGFARGRAVGLLDQDNRPTWQMPVWKQMPRQLRRIRDHSPPERW